MSSASAISNLKKQEVVIQGSNFAFQKENACSSSSLISVLSEAVLSEAVLSEAVLSEALLYDAKTN